MVAYTVRDVPFNLVEIRDKFNDKNTLSVEADIAAIMQGHDSAELLKGYAE